MGATLELSGSIGTITLEGDVSVSNAEGLKKTLIKALLDSDEIRVSADNVEDLDLSCLQLLCSGHRSAARLNKRIFLTGSPAKIFRNMVDSAGFARLTGCKLDCEKSCLWTTFEGAE